MPDSKHDALMRDVAKTQAEAERLLAKGNAALEAQDPGSTNPNRTDNPLTDGKPMKDPSHSNKHSSPF